MNGSHAVRANQIRDRRGDKGGVPPSCVVRQRPPRVAKELDARMVHAVPGDIIETPQTGVRTMVGARFGGYGDSVE